MKKTVIYISSLLLLIGTLSCKKTKNSSESAEQHQDADHDDHNEEGEHGEHEEELLFTQEQLAILDIKMAKATKRNLSGFVEVNGRLEVPPQNEAIVTTILGANISSIKAIEGDRVKKGQTLAYISHPDIINMQTNYLQSYNKLTFLEQDFNRQKKLYDAGVGSGRDYQQATAEFSSGKGLVKGLESQLKLLGLSAKSVQAGNIVQSAPVRSPIEGYIEKVLIKTGQFVLPQTALFEVVNTEHIHADLMVFEKDVNKVKNNQKVIFNIEVLGDKEMTAKIYSVGKSFEEGPKALHIHAEIDNKDKNLIPGMYVNARIITEEKLEQALPESAIFQDNETFYAFTAEKKDNGNWGFTPQEVLVSSSSNGFTAYVFKEKQNEDVLIAQGGAYYLMAEMKKSEAGHSH